MGVKQIAVMGVGGVVVVAMLAGAWQMLGGGGETTTTEVATTGSELATDVYGDKDAVVDDLLQESGESADVQNEAGVFAPRAAIPEAAVGTELSDIPQEEPPEISEPPSFGDSIDPDSEADGRVALPESPGERTVESPATGDSAVSVPIVDAAPRSLDGLGSRDAPANFDADVVSSSSAPIEVSEPPASTTSRPTLDGPVAENEGPRSLDPMDGAQPIAQPGAHPVAQPDARPEARSLAGEGGGLELDGGLGTGTRREGDAASVGMAGGLGQQPVIHTVQTGESYWTISRKYYGSARYFQALAAFNRGRIRDPKRMRPGMKVQVPDRGMLESRFAKWLPVSSVARSGARTVGFQVDANGRPIYVVDRHDTLTEIATRYLGRTTRWIQIYHMNRDQLPSPHKLKPGTVLRMPADAVHLPAGR